MRGHPEPKDQWPKGCRGSRRPWLVFVGPSPGGKHQRDEEAEPLWNQPFTAPFGWGGGFPRSMPTLLAALLPEAAEADRLLLYAVYNLDSVQNPEASEVPLDRMRRGAPHIVSLLESAPPRLIVPMESICFGVLNDALREHGYDFRRDGFPISISIYDNPKRLHRSISGFRIRGKGPLTGSIVVKLPQHPAKILRPDYAAKCGEAVRKLFEELVATSS